MASEAAIAGAGTEAFEPRGSSDVDVYEWIRQVQAEYERLVERVAELMRKVVRICGSGVEYRGVRIAWDWGPDIEHSTYKGRLISAENILEVLNVLERLAPLAEQYAKYADLEAAVYHDRIRLWNAVRTAEGIGIPVPEPVLEKLRELEETYAEAVVGQERIRARVCRTNKPAEQIPAWFFEVA